MLVLTLGFTGGVRLVVVLTSVSALNQAALVAPSLATTLGLDMLVSLPPLALWHAHGESKVFNPLLYLDPDELTTSPVADSDRVCDWSHNSRVILLLHQGFPHTVITCKLGTGELDLITMQAVAFSVLLFPCLVASQLHSTVDVVGFLHSQSTTFTPAAMQPSDSQQSIGKEQPVVTLASTDTAEGAPIAR